MMGKMSVEGKTILLGNGSILNIDAIKDERFYTCSYYSKESETNIGDILVPIYSCVHSEKESVDFESVSSSQPTEKKKESEDIDVISVEDITEKRIDPQTNDIRVTVKKFSNEMKLIKITKKSVHFIDDDGKNRYVGLDRLKKIYNHGIINTPDVSETVEKRTENVMETVKTPEENTKDYTEVEDQSNDKPKNKKTTTKTENKKEKNNKSKVKTTGDFEYLNEIPEEVDYRKEERSVFIDLPNVGSVRVKYIRKGRLFWENLETGKYSAISLKKVNKENWKLYEYK